MKTFGAGIFCSVCSAQPYPNNPATTRESFDLQRVNGEWFCERCRPAQKRAARPVASSPLEALRQFEQLLEGERARFEGALVEDCEDCGYLIDDFRVCSDEIARGLAELRKVLTPQKPPASPDDALKGRRSQKKISAKERAGDGQVDWVSGDAQSANEAAP
jgi:hypothetical protein